MEMKITKVKDFEVTGSGSAPQWKSAEWQTLKLVSKLKSPYSTRAKVVYSEKGIYFLFDNEDRKLTCTMFRDCQDIYQEDVVEVFLWTDEGKDLYFEYELSPLAIELPIVVPNHKGAFMGWRPWHYEGDRVTRRATSVRGGPREPMAGCEAWMAEFFIPFALLRGLGNTPPKAGTRWRGNLYRIDYDAGKAAQWAWCEASGTNFHNFHHFGTLVFE